MKNILIVTFFFLSFSAFSQSAIVIGNDTDTTWRYNTWSEFVKSRFYVNPTGKENKFFKINAAGNGFDFVDPNNFSGSGTANRLAYWISSTGLSSSSDFTFNPATRTATFGTAGLASTFDFLSTGARIRFQDFGSTVWSTTAGAELMATMSYDNGPYGRVTLYDPGNVIAARLGGSGDNYTKRNFGIGTTTPANALHVYKTDANDAAMTYVARFGHGTNGTAGVGVATGFEYALEDNAGNMDVVATTGVVSTSVTNGTESADIVWKTMQAGTLAERARLSSGVLNVATGFRVNSSATSGQYLRGNGTEFVSSAIQSSDISSLTWMIGGQAVGSTQSLGTTGATGVNYITNNVNRFRLDSGGRMFAGTLTDFRFSVSDTAEVTSGSNGWIISSGFSRLVSNGLVALQANNSTGATAMVLPSNQSSAFTMSISGGATALSVNSTTGAEVTTVGTSTSAGQTVLNSETTKTNGADVYAYTVYTATATLPKETYHIANMSSSGQTLTLASSLPIGTRQVIVNVHATQNVTVAAPGGETISGTATVNATESAEFFKVATTWYRVVYK